MQKDIKLLDRVIGVKKEMYLAILQHLASGFTEEETAIIFNKTVGRISQIFIANRQLCDELTLDSELATKAGRLRLAYKVIKKKGTKSHRDCLDWVEYTRKEKEGEKPLIEINQRNLVNIYLPEKKADKDVRLATPAEARIIP